MADLMAEKVTRTPKASCATDLELEQLTFTFVDGKDTTRVVRISDFPDSIVKKLALHGLEQKLRDCYASKEISAEQAVGVQDKVADALRAGEWSQKRGDGSGSTDSVNMLYQAAVAAYAEAGLAAPEELSLANLTAATKEVRAQVRSVPEIAVQLAKLRAAKATSAPTLASLFGPHTA